MLSELKFLRLDFKIDEAWDGRALNAPLPHFEAPHDSGGTTALLCACLAASSPTAKLVGEAADELQAVRLTAQVASGRWLLTRDFTRQEVEFVCEATGEITPLPVKSQGGLQSAGAFFVDLLGLPVVETERGTVTVDALLRLLTLSQDRTVTARVGGAVGGDDNAATWELAAGLLDAEALRARNRYRAAAAARTKAERTLARLQDARRETGRPAHRSWTTGSAATARKTTRRWPPSRTPPRPWRRPHSCTTSISRRLTGRSRPTARPGTPRSTPPAPWGRAMSGSVWPAPGWRRPKPA